jgi:hypothetical protein
MIGEGMVADSVFDEDGGAASGSSSWVSRVVKCIAEFKVTFLGISERSMISILRAARKAWSSSACWARPLAFHKASWRDGAGASEEERRSEEVTKEGSCGCDAKNWKGALRKFGEDRREKSKHGAQLFKKGLDEVFEVLGIR